MTIPTLSLFHFNIFAGNLEQAAQIFLDKIETSSPTSLADEKPPFVIFTPNTEQLVIAEHDSAFRKNLSSGNLLLPDGMGLVSASRMLAFTQSVGAKKVLRERISGVDLVRAVLPKLAGKKVVIIGGRYTQEVEEQRMKLTEFPETTLHWIEGYKQVAHPSAQEEQTIAEFLQTMKPDVLFVAFGAPFQEKWIIEHRDLLNQSGVKVAMVVGGSFDFLLGKVKRAPRIVQVLGFEWLYRLIQEPWRIGRQLRIIEFMLLTVKTLFIHLF
jgi:N-acetylglucosaminyldiphosphoundecaprenol N-acetyl-beta-D-mannosaminyltransferase